MRNAGRQSPASKAQEGRATQWDFELGVTTLTVCICFLFLIFEVVQSKLGLNLRSFCFSIPSAWVTGMYHLAQVPFYFLTEVQTAKLSAKSEDGGRLMEGLTHGQHDAEEGLCFQEQASKCPCYSK